MRVTSLLVAVLLCPAATGCGMFWRNTITRSAGSWSGDGFSAGDQISVTGSASNDGQYQIQ